MQIIPLIVISSIILVIVKILKKESFSKNIIKLTPFYIILLFSYFVTALIWDGFIEGKSKLFHYWDQLPLSGFMLWTHDQPATRSLSQDLAPGISLFTIDLIWLGMLLSLYGISLLLYWVFFLKNDKRRLGYALVIVVFMITLALLLGFNKRGIVL